LVLLILPIGGVLNFVVNNYVVVRDRPDLAELTRVVSVDAPAYPSGHVTTAVLLYGYLFVMAGRIDYRAVRAVVRTACFMIVALAGFGRVWFGAHWPSDVLGSFALGGAVLVTAIAVTARIERSGRWPLISRAPPSNNSRSHSRRRRHPTHPLQRR
jgi:undecaprenyl-diphosphatase